MIYVKYELFQQLLRLKTFSPYHKTVKKTRNAKIPQDKKKNKRNVDSIILQFVLEPLKKHNEFGVVSFQTYDLFQNLTVDKCTWCAISVASLKVLSLCISNLTSIFLKRDGWQQYNLI